MELVLQRDVACAFSRNSVPCRWRAPVCTLLFTLERSADPARAACQHLATSVCTYLRGALPDSFESRTKALHCGHRTARSCRTHFAAAAYTSWLLPAVPQPPLAPLPPLRPPFAALKCPLALAAAASTSQHCGGVRPSESHHGSSAAERCDLPSPTTSRSGSPGACYQQVRLLTLCSLVCFHHGSAGASTHARAGALRTSAVPV